MLAKTKTPATTDAYIAAAPKEFQSRLKEMRAIIAAAAPGAEEKISYGMPSFWLNGVLVYFAAWKDHMGLYPASAGIGAFSKELAKYDQTKGSVHFPHDKPLPKALIAKIVKYRIQENLKRAEAKAKPRTCPKGHKYFKTSDCPTCPICEKAKSLPDPFLAGIAAPARRALESIGVGTARQLAKHAEGEILALHGMGPKAFATLKASLKKAGLSFRKG